jgi:hypothetical protein
MQSTSSLQISDLIAAKKMMMENTETPRMVSVPTQMMMDLGGVPTMHMQNITSTLAMMGLGSRPQYNHPAAGHQWGHPPGKRNRKPGSPRSVYKNYQRTVAAKEVKLATLWETEWRYGRETVRPPWLHKGAKPWASTSLH